MMNIIMNLPLRIPITYGKSAASQKLEFARLRQYNLFLKIYTTQHTERVLCLFLIKTGKTNGESPHIGEQKLQISLDHNNKRKKWRTSGL